uniref:CNH domain-containing protein n=1 Tax=Leptobrachium leishanense TaxID=445787 RepID=A0A8C5PQC9_9ANUR
MLLKHFDFPLPCPLRLFQMLVIPGEQYPLVCIGVRKVPALSLRVQFQTVNLNSLTSWFTDSGSDSSWVGPVQLVQRGSDGVLVLTDNTLSFVDLHGEAIHGSHVPEVLFTFSVEAVAVTGDKILVLRNKGYQELDLWSAEVRHALDPPGGI